MANPLFYIILAIIVFEFIFSNYLSWLNSNSWKTEVPNELKGIYDESEYRKAQEYAKANKQISLISGVVQFVLILGMLLFGGFAWLDGLVRYILGNNAIFQALLFFGILFIGSEIIGLPFSLYKTFVIEEKFGFNKTSIGTYIVDKLKGYLITAIIGGGLLALLVYLFTQTGQWFWLLAWGVVTAFTLLMVTFYTSWLLPLFNKLSPLEEGELKDRILSYSKKVDFPLKNIFIMDASKRSSKSNAFFSGLGNQKSIVLFDTLVEEHSTDELVAVLAHEVGHYKRKHIFKNQIISIVTMGILFFVLGWSLSNPALFKALGVTLPSFHIGVIAFSLLYSPISMIIGILMNRLSRKYEYEADAFAKETSDGQALEDCLKKMSTKHLSNLTPHPLFVSVHYSHPPLLSRLKALSGN